MYLYCQEVNKPKLLQSIIEDRKETILAKLNAPSSGNLNALFSTKEAQDIIGKHPSKNLPPHYFIIEKSAQNTFGCLLSCWTEFEIFRTIQNSVRSAKEYTNNNLNTYSTQTINEHYCYEIVPDIALDTRLFHTNFSEQPLLLSDAIVLINIATFIKEHQWYEMLTLLDISSKGEHYILYQLDEGNAYPSIISSALINSPHVSNEWLFFNDFFQNEKWQSIHQPHTVSNLQQATKGLIKLDDAHLSNKSSNDIENHLFSSIVDSKKVCEAIRLTVSGNKSKANFHLYLAQKGLANALKQSGREVVFTIIEKPAMVLFYQSMNLEAPMSSPYLFTSAQDINKNGVVTYKGIWLLNNATDAFNQYNFKEYNVKIIGLRKLSRHN